MKCHAYCLVSEYRLDHITPLLKKHPAVQVFNDAISLPILPSESQEIFFFSYGIVVFWNIPIEEHQHYLDLVAPAASDTLDITEDDEFQFSYGEVAKIYKNEIILPNQDSLTKLAASHAIAQSVKLGFFEQTILQLIKKTEPIPRQMAETGKQPLSAKSLRRLMGKLYIDLSSVNLHFDLLDEPDFFWDYEDIEPIYAMTSDYLDIQDRVTVLNQRLQVVRDLFEMLSDELKHQHSARLEWTIIILIVIEVALTLSTDIFKWI